ncbi:11459_t:CDS:2 [Acaulospora morrowiae]|uniref:11459_t:CDS:1 n=1 Tax=Acaulospora morrowiae TaxID=94023 RepID=A0A9N9AAR8_9GLOM|nr:11459_t:CDS:2 [Acaulospora morrowiae]
MPKTSSTSSRKSRKEINAAYRKRKKDKLESLKSEATESKNVISRLLGQIDILREEKTRLENENRELKKSTRPVFLSSIGPVAFTSFTSEQPSVNSTGIEIGAYSSDEQSSTLDPIAFASFTSEQSSVLKLSLTPPDEQYSTLDIRDMTSYDPSSGR